MLQDPLGDVARKERRSLLGICIIAIFVGWTGLIPHEITNLGLKFEAPDRAIVQKLFVGVVTYYLIAFAVYAYSDILRWFYEIYLGDQEELKKRRDVSASPEPNRERPIEAPWSWIRQVPRASLFRGLFDLVVPLLIAAFAIYSLLFVIPIRTKTRSTPEPPCLNVRSHVTLDIRNG